MRFFAVLIVLFVFQLIPECYSAATYYVNGSIGDDTYDGLASEWDGTHGQKKTIQAGINVSNNNDTVMAADGIYSEAGNFNLAYMTTHSYLLNNRFGR